MAALISGAVELRINGRKRTGTVERIDTLKASRPGSSSQMHSSPRDVLKIRWHPRSVTADTAADGLALQLSAVGRGYSICALGLFTNRRIVKNKYCALQLACPCISMYRLHKMR